MNNPRRRAKLREDNGYRSQLHANKLEGRYHNQQCSEYISPIALIQYGEILLHWKTLEVPVLVALLCRTKGLKGYSLYIYQPSHIHTFSPHQKALIPCPRRCFPARKAVSQEYTGGKYSARKNAEVDGRSEQKMS